MDGQDGETVVQAECTEDGIDRGIDKASTGDTNLEVLQPDPLQGASNVVKSILDTANESLQILPPDDFFMGVARAAQDGLEHVGTAVTTRFGASQAPLPKSICMSRPGGVSTRAKTRGISSFSFRQNLLTEL